MRCAHHQSAVILASAGIQYVTSMRSIAKVHFVRPTILDSRCARMTAVVAEASL